MATATISGIYEIVNLVNGKRYVGSAKKFDTRWRTHRGLLLSEKHHSRHLQRAWLKYGEDSFRFKPLLVCDIKHLILYEQLAIDALDPEYNISKTAGSTLGVKYTDESRRRVSEALKGKMKGRKRTSESVAKTAAAHRGTKRSAETRAKLSEAAIGSKKPPRSAEHKAKLSAIHKGRQKSPEHMAALQEGRAKRQFTDEQRAKMSEAVKASYVNGIRSRERPAEYREKIAASLRGRPLPQATRDKISATTRGKKRGPRKKKSTAAQLSLFD